MATFKDGLEAAAKLLENRLNDTATLEGVTGIIRDILATPDPDAKQLVLFEGVSLEEWFTRFKLAYVTAGGCRNPKSTEAKSGWTPAWKVFERLVKKQKVEPLTIIDGTIAYVKSQPEGKYVPAPEVFLHKEQFARAWGQAPARRPTADDIDRHLSKSFR